MKTKDKPAPFRVRVGYTKNRKAWSTYVGATDLRHAEVIQRKTAQHDKAARILDVEELVSHTWMLRKRWTRRNGKVKWEVKRT